MPDYSIPSVTLPSDGAQINITIPQTQAFVTDQGYTYNQAGQTYNQAGVTYGGVTAETEDVIPVFSDVAEQITPQILTAMLITPSMNVDQTDAFLTDQGYTYNQAGFTYNQADVVYGGVTNATQDILPLSLSFTDIHASRQLIRLLEDGSYRLLENGGIRLLE